ncbi:MAG: PAS domain S-box protein [Acidimicrobiia bacterium]
MTPLPPGARQVPRVSLGTRLLIVASASFLALVVAIVVLVVLENRQENDDQLVAHSFEVRSAIQEVGGLLVDAETGVRGYLLTSEQVFLNPYVEATTSLGPALDRLDALVNDNTAQVDRSARIRRASERRLEMLDELTRTDDATARLRGLEFGRALMDGIRLDLAQMEVEEDRLLAERTATAEQNRNILAAFIPAAGMIGLVGLVTTIAFATRITRRVSSITANAVRLGTGEPLSPVRHTTDDIGRLSEAIVDAAATLRSREEQLKSAREFLEYLIDEGPVVMFRKRLKPPQKLTYISPNVERVLGVRQDSAIGTEHFFSSLLADDHREAFTQGARAAAAGQVQGWYGEYQTAANHGAERWVAIDVKVQRDDAGAPTHLLGYVLDITDRISATAAARSAERLYHQLFERIPTGIVVTRLDGRIVDTNPAMAKMLGFESAEALMTEVADIGTFYADPGERLQFVETMRDQRSVTDYEVRFRRLDGTIINVAINGRLVDDENGEPAGIEGTAIDVTARRHAEEETRHARAEADRANQAKSIFLSRMSHELRTPLNSIIGFAQLLDLSEPALDARSRESVSHILKGGRHLLDLIDEVLDIAQVEAGRLNMSLEPVSVYDTLAESIDLIRPLAAARRITVNVADGCGEHVLADRQRLKQIFLNLLSNAVKYNQNAGAVDVTCDLSNGDVGISVSDTGLGITAEQLERLFTPFDRLGAEQSGQQGTGLGLVLSRHLAEAMGGRLSVESVPGEGATFTVTLPRTEPQEPESTVAGSQWFDPSRPRGGNSPRTVIYIEDNLANLRLIERILALRPNITLEASMQGSLGLDLVRQHMPDLVLLDLNLPDMGGRDVLLELRSDPATRQIPVVVISADASEGQIQRLLDAGANGYLTKPVDVVELLRHIDEIFA